MGSGWGLTRAELTSHGVGLPLPGSFRDTLLQELAYRTRMQRYVEVAMFAQLLAKGLGVIPEEVTQILGFYEDVMNHRAFLPGVMERFLASRGDSRSNVAHNS